MHTHILVVGHDESTSAMLSNNLGRPGFEVQTATDAADALRKISQRQPDVIVVDATTPGPSHWDVPEWRSTDTTPIVALSTRPQLKEVVAREGVWVCLVKPVKADVLVGAVERIATFRSARCAKSVA